MRVAACLVVRNEASDIASWLGWYRLLGFDACIVYDDHSTDDTVAVLNHVGRHQDVRVRRTRNDGNVQDHIGRQDGSYVDALLMNNGEFDWIGFFDSDEYVRLHRHERIQDLIGQHPGAGCIGINWCNYGSSGHVLKPAAPPVEAYTHHFESTAPINRHFKSLVRVEEWDGTCKGPHAFAVRRGDTVDASGTPVAWSDIFGISARDPDWSVAKVMHYQCRSMEHFIERLKRNPYLPRTTELWNSYDVNAVEDRVPLTVLGEYGRILRSYAPDRPLPSELPQQSPLHHALWPASPVLTLAPSVIGCVDELSETVVRGWIIDRDHAGDAVHAAILIDDQVRLEIVCEHRRPDLLAAVWAPTAPVSASGCPRMSWTVCRTRCGWWWACRRWSASRSPGRRCR